MPVYTVEDPVSGVVLDLEGAVPPSELELDEIFSQYRQPDPAPEPFVQEVEEEDDTGIIGQTGEFLKAVPRGLLLAFYPPLKVLLS